MRDPQAQPRLGMRLPPYPFPSLLGFEVPGFGFTVYGLGLRDLMFGLRCFQLSWVLRKPKEFQNDHPPESIQLYITFLY